MKLAKQDAAYKYYEISERESDEYGVDAEVIAIAKKDLRYMKAKDALADGFYRECEADYRKDPSYVIPVWVVIPESIRIAE